MPYRDAMSSERWTDAAKRGWITRRANAKAKEEARARAREAAAAADLAAYEAFQKAESGFFNGYEMIDTFHKFYKKDNAVFIGESDDSADVITPFGTFHAGADEIICYFFSQEPKKIVRYNWSVYFI